MDRAKHFKFSLSYLIIFNLVLLRVPDFLGHASLHYLSQAHKHLDPTWATLLLSFSFVIAMEIYTRVLLVVTAHMTTANIFPRFLFVAQLYYYLFWYMMLMVLTPSGLEEIRFWVMVVVMNLQYLASNSASTRASSAPCAASASPCQCRSRCSSTRRWRCRTSWRT
jgi:hypothetical protein